MGLELTDMDPGVYIQNVNGWRSPGLLVRMAQASGFKLPNEEDEEILTRHLNNSYPVDILHDGLLPSEDSEAVQEMSDEAMEWLNHQLAPTKLQFGWVDGELVLLTESDWERYKT